MCDPCRAKWATISDQQRNCSRPGCEHTWTWTKQEQIEAFATKRQPPKRLCDACAGELAALETKEVPCSAPGCSRVAKITPEQQLLGGAPQGDEPKPGEITITGPLCEPCREISPKLKDKPINCGINGCKRKWIWKADEQLATFAAGKPDVPPRRMCEACRANFGKLLDREVRCRASGCKKTWTWTREDQLDACVADKAPPKPPERLCESCFKIWSGLKDVERPCRQGGCARTWTDRRGAQLARILRGKTGDPYPQYCEEHGKLVEQLQDREIPCKTEGCTHTWTWTKNQQLAAGVRPPELAPDAPAVAESEPSGGNDAADVPEVATGEAVEAAADATENGAPAAAAPVGQGRGKRKRRRRRREVQPPSRHCARCAKFLSEHKTVEIPCGQCATPIFWPPESQLQTELGNWAQPTLCGACKRDVTEAQRLAAKEALRAGGAALTIEGATHAVPEPVAPETPPAPAAEPTAEG
jgi:hypothetical protein